MPLRLATHACGTRFELVLGGESPRLRAAGEAALRAVEDVDRRLSLFRRDSLLAHVCRTAARTPVRLDADTFELLELCAAVHRASGGAFDPTVAPLMRALALHGTRSQAPDVPPAEARARVGFDAVRLDAATRRVALDRDGVWLDLGAVGKGHALDLAARELREAGVARALLHGGTSTVLALGAPPDAEGWRVRIGSGPEAPVVVLRDAALSVSAPRAGTDHVLDPRTGAPSAAARYAAVLTTGALAADAAARADAWSTALLATGDADAVPGDLETLTPPLALSAP